jgi:hypothetical protein
MVVGADIALTHGALVTLDGRVLHRYYDQPGMSGSVDDWFATAFLAAGKVPLRSIVIVDWDRDIGRWGHNPTIGVLLTMSIAFFVGQCFIRNCSVHLVTPAMVREALGLDRYCSKETVHGATELLVPPRLFRDSDGDCHDAWLLAHLFSIGAFL